MHSQFSWDAPRGDMEASCRRALELGLPAIAFTEHADFVGGGYSDHRPLDVAGYLVALDRCRQRFPSLRVLSGVELGQPHRFPSEAAEVLSTGRLDRVLGSVHCVPWAGGLVDVSVEGLLTPERAPDLLRSYLAEMLALVERGQGFEVLAHLDYPKRYWPHAKVMYREEDYEEEFRAVLRAAAVRGLVLEVNTTRGMEPGRGLCPGPTVLRWWVEEGGRALSFGSDAHDPERVALGFGLAAQLAEGLGFKPNDDPTGFWRR
ncbi:MAG TPA: histidinol-phosphatase HisJ family protein [Candidatus Dormibacteraeota bacterium]|nr:histidinol-phosphatase HisJ family protein [Candidatus Dormibacteraeota bacterium]